MTGTVEHAKLGRQVRIDLGLHNEIYFVDNSRALGVVATSPPGLQWVGKRLLWKHSCSPWQLYFSRDGSIPHQSKSTLSTAGNLYCGTNNAQSLLNSSYSWVLAGRQTLARILWVRTFKPSMNVLCSDISTFDPHVCNTDVHRHKIQDVLKDVQFEGCAIISPAAMNSLSLIHEVYSVKLLNIMTFLFERACAYLFLPQIHLTRSDALEIWQAVQMAEKSIQDPEASEGDVVCAPKLLEIMLQACRGRIDQYVPHFISLATKRCAPFESLRHVHKQLFPVKHNAQDMSRALSMLNGLLVKSCGEHLWAFSYHHYRSHLLVLIDSTIQNLFWVLCCRTDVGNVRYLQAELRSRLASVSIWGSWQYSCICRLCAYS